MTSREEPNLARGIREALIQMLHHRRSQWHVYGSGQNAHLADEILSTLNLPELNPENPQGKPSDAYVLAALNRYYVPDGIPAQSLSDWSEGAVRAMRAVLRGDFEVEGE